MGTNIKEIALLSINKKDMYEHELILEVSKDGWKSNNEFNSVLNVFMVMIS